EKELEILGNLKVKSLIIMVPGLKEWVTFQDNFIIDFLKNTNIEKFSTLKGFYKQNGKIFKTLDNGERMLIK
ncbi:MAG: hypothetical protein QM490_05755, partial [Candidatus Gracilibacteria bacterium]